MEIERKFTIRRLPDQLECYEKKEIEQGYLCTDPVVRIRRSNDSYILTYKGHIARKDTTARVCNELEAPLSESSYLHLREKTDNHMVKKCRYIIPLENGLRVELDIFAGRLEGLVFAEVEFPDEQAAQDFIMPEWFLEDVSGDCRYSNSFLSGADSYEDWKKAGRDQQIYGC
ncbi:CYTH domain-containing protein [Anaerolentibacter hominis]|uniref:CYTH domain-containing protein n=1 Tax=Anaerolentibacter hominis TaxID=3079009 RepID=UPI0031B84648